MTDAHVAKVYQEKYGSVLSEQQLKEILRDPKRRKGLLGSLRATTKKVK